MPEIAGHFPIDPDPARMRPCVLCLEPTDVLAAAPGLGAGVELPLHVFCAAWLVRAYGKLEAGRALSMDASRLLLAYGDRVKELAAGGA